MRTLRVGGGALAPAAAGAVRKVVRDGGVAVFPTDTFYALGADPFDPGAMDRVYRLKGRGRDRPLLVLVDSPARLHIFAAAVTARHRLLAEAFWPGPLTLLFRARRSLPPAITSAAGEVALRVPGSALCREILLAAGGALTGTSANPTGAGDPLEPPSSPGLAADLVLDAGRLPPSKPSTLLALRRGEAIILREGEIPRHSIDALLASPR